MKLGTKIALGFAALIAISILLGGLAIYNMKDIEARSSMLAHEYVPEVDVANNIERFSLLTMYDMRGYGLSEEAKYLEGGRKNLGEVGKWLTEANALADRSPHLVKLKGQIGDVQAKVNEYERLVNETVSLTESINKNRGTLDTAAANYMNNCSAFLEGQNAAFKKDLTERQQKIALVSDIVNIGTAVRVLNFKSQATGDAGLMEQAIAKLAEVDEKTAELRKITHLAEDIKRIDDTESAAAGYKTAMQAFLAEFKKGENADTQVLDQQRQAMDTNAGTYVTNCAAFLEGQQAALDKDMHERHDKITLVNDIIDVGNATRIACFKSQAMRDPQLIRDANANFDVMDQKFEELRKITRLEEDLKRIDQTKQAAQNYRTAMNKLLDNWLALQDTSNKRGAAADAVLAGAQTTAAAGLEQTNSIAQEAVSALSLSSTVLIVGLGVATVLGFLLAWLITRGITKAINRIIDGLSEGAEQVNDAAAQVSTASQALAGGASEQASSLEETSSALEEMAAMTRTNAGNAKEANELAGQARTAAGEGDRSMDQLNAAMTGINESSEKISKIIKVIEEIAFQTNLLALNAAVEAARAGEHGKGFAVVADEVRNLAMRAAEAARETTSLIEDAVSRAQEGTQVAGEVGKALGAIVGDVTKVSDLINGIAQASEEQAQGVEQVNTAVGQMDKVTQQNASGAEESASAAEELAAQSEAVRGMVQELIVLVGGKKASLDRGSTRSPSRGKASPRPTKAASSSGAAVKVPAGAPEDFMTMDDDDGDLNSF